MEWKTLREICNELEVSRRAVQGYEKAGLLRASGRSDRGYLLYDEEACERILRIRLYQKIGFSIREICSFIDASDEEIIEILKGQIQKLEKDKEDIDDLIRQVNELMEMLQS